MKSSRRRSLVNRRTVSLAMAVTVFTLSTAVASDEAPRRAWQWSDGEQLAERSNDGSAARRAAVSKRSDGASEQSNAAVYDVIDGSRNPELFLEFELFDQMMMSGFADDWRTREAYRSSKEAARQSSGLPAEFWERAGAIAAPYLKDRLEERRLGILGARSGKHEREQIANNILLCRDRAAALAGLRREFPRFREFLYSAIAPTMSMTVLRKPDMQLQQIASGECR